MRFLSLLKYYVFAHRRAKAKNSKPGLAPVFAVSLAERRFQNLGFSARTDNLDEYQKDQVTHRAGRCNTRKTPASATVPNT